MKYNKVLILILLIISFVSLNAQTYLTEGFETGEIPDGWTQDYVSGIQDWRYRNGGHSPNDDNWSLPADQEDITRNPPSAYEGTYNAIFFQQGYDNERTKLITAPIDLDGGVNVELSFYLCQIPWTFGGSTAWDILRIYYKADEADPWVLLEEYIDPIYDWEQKKLLLPDASATYYLAFEGHSRWGYGTCVDDIFIEEVGSTPMFLANIDFIQPFTNFIPSGSQNVPLLRTDFRVLGNTGAVMLNEMEFISLNSSDSDIVPNSLKLYATINKTFNTDNPIGNASSFSSGKVTFTGLNDSIPRGSSYIWLVGDIEQSATHENVLDILVAANSVKANGQTYPETDHDPTGARVIYETRYYDGFEGAHNWTLTGEFEVATPNGMAGETGNPNPEKAFSGLYALGTDLTGQGAFDYSYEPGLTDVTSYKATSPTIDVLYYKNVNLFYKRYLNVGANDKAKIEVSTDNGISWNTIWDNLATVTDFEWSEELLPIPGTYAKTAEFKFRFIIGPTNTLLNYTGWNLDDIFITGEFISKDVGVSEWVAPQSGSGHTSSDSVTLRIVNYGGADITDPVPVAFSINGGDNWTVDYMYQDIPVGGEVLFTFPSTIDLSEPGLYPSIIAKTFIPGDQDLTNDQLTTELFIIPTHTPPHEEDFEANNGFWKPSGNLWEYGAPAGEVINSASSGSYSWMTSLYSYYGNQLLEGNYVLFEDNFELDMGWSYTGEFERGQPNSNYIPYNAYYTGLYCIGTDFTGTGDTIYFYEYGITPATAYTATSPAIDVLNYVNLEINFARWITIQAGDSVKIEVSPDNGSTWNTIWKNEEGEIFDIDWAFFGYNIPDNLSNTTNLKIRFSLFYSSTSGAVAEGFNIDDFSLTGDLVVIEPAILDSPSYDLSGIDKPVLDAMIWTDTEAGMDGVSLYYSLDEGNNWTPISNSSGFDTYWNWYTGHPVTSLGLNGWSGQSGGWIHIRHLLPPGVINQDNVQFRFKFLSDKTNNEFDGIAIDDISILEAPFDIGIEDILSPATTCELSQNEKFTVRFKNYGIRTMLPGDTIEIGYYIDKDGVVQSEQEIYVLTQSFSAGETLDLNLNSEFDFSENGDYYTSVFTIDTHPLFYYESSNDSINELIQVNKPTLDLGPDISTVSPDTVVLRAFSGEAGNTYLWQDGSTNATFNVDIEGTYNVKVTNGLGCSSYDTIQVLQLVVDVGVTTLTGIVSGCESGILPIQITVENLGTDTIETSETIFVFGEIDQTLEFSESLVLIQRLKPGESINYTFPGNYDFSTPGSYPMKLYTQLTNDVTFTNDTLFYLMEVYGYPDIDLGADTTVYAAEYVLNPGPGYFEYIWQDESTLETFTITQGGSNTYSVSVSDEHQCISQDAVDVTLKVADLELEEILSPGSSCEVTTTITVSARIRNLGNEAIPSGETINMAYTLNGGPAVEEALVLTSDLQPSTSLDYTFTNSESVSTNQWYDFIVYIDFAEDTKSWNDTLYKSVGVYESPDIDLGDPVQVISALEHTLDAGTGFVSYEWQDGSTNQTFTISQPGVGTYGVTVIDNNGCEHYEEVQILMVVPDIGVLDIVYPVTACELNSAENLIVAVKNFGLETIDPSANISVAYSINGADAIVEKLILGTGFEGESVIYHTFLTDEDFSTPDRYEIVAYTEFSSDLIPTNDIIIEIVDVLGSPVVDIGNGRDTVATNTPMTLSVETGYLLYEWQDGSSNPDYEIPDPSAGLYTVKVTAGNGCITVDSVFVIYDIPDLAVINIVSPVTSCEIGTNGIVSMEIVNEGYFRISETDDLTVTYSIDGGSSEIEVMNLSNDLLPGDTTILTFSKGYDFSAVGDYNVSVTLIYTADTDFSDNLLSGTITVLGNPSITLEGGVDLIKTELPYIIDAGVGYSSYLWQDNSGGTTFEVNEYGWYWVIVSDANGCTGIDSVYIDFPISTEEIAIKDGEITIFPNPVKDFLHVILETDGDLEITFEIYNMLNAIVYKEYVSHSIYSDNKIDVQRFTPGTYYLHISTDEAHYVCLIIVL